MQSASSPTPTKNIRIIRGTVEDFVSRPDFHELTVLLQLKALYKSNSIHGYRKRFNSIATILGISESKLRKCINYLKREGFAWVEQAGQRLDLRLCGTSAIAKIFGTDKFRKHKISFTTNKKLETKIKAVVLQQNLSRQKYKIKEIIVDKLQLKRGTNVKAQYIG